MKLLANLIWLLFSFEERLGWKGYFLGLGLLVALFGIFKHECVSFGMCGYGDYLIPIIAGSAMAGLSFALQSKRLHDFGKSGWWALLAFTLPSLMPHTLLNKINPIIVAIVVIGIWPSDKTPNKYGDPYTTLFPPDPAPEAAKPEA